MAITVVKWESSGLKGTVTLKADDFAEVASTAAKTKAIEEGTKHLGLCGLSGASGPYPVDDLGNEIVDARALATMSKSKVKIEYHNDFYLTQSLSL